MEEDKMPNPIPTNSFYHHLGFGVSAPYFFWSFVLSNYHFGKLSFLPVFADFEARFSYCIAGHPWER
jgi:hypothetical protein